MPAARTWEDRVNNLKVYQRNGRRAPHKPLLLLMAISRLLGAGANIEFGFTDAEAQLGPVIAEFSSTSSGPGKVEYPFQRLANDGLWIVEADGELGGVDVGVSDLRQRAARGRLDDGFAAALLTDPSLVRRVVESLLAAYFPESIHEDVLAAVALDPAIVSGTADLAIRRQQRRDPEFRRKVLLAYERRCAMCGWDARVDDTLIGVEAAHVRWFAYQGPDEVANGLCLCVLHHKLFDLGVMGISQDRRIAVSSHFNGTSEAAELQVLSLAGRDVREPQRGFDRLEEQHVEWHTREVFKSPGRIAV